MKFLIFNVIVFCSLGYVLTSSQMKTLASGLLTKKIKL